MATSNVQRTGLEEGVFWVSDEMGEKFYFDFDEVKEIIEDLRESVKVYDKEDKELYEIEFKVDIESCYYDGFVFVVKGNSQGKRDYNWDDLLRGWDISETSYNKLEKAVRKLERKIKKLPGVQEIRCVARASNGEAMYALVN